MKYIKVALLLAAGFYTSTSIGAVYNYDFNVFASDNPSAVNAGPYGSIEISDGEYGDIDFSFELNPNGFVDPNDKFGIGKFFFNTEHKLEKDEIVDWDPSNKGWSLFRNDGSTGPVYFDIELKGKKTATLDFTISKAGDSILDYIMLNDDGYLFGAHVQAFGGKDDASAWIYVSAVPVPAAFWLFGTALIGLVGFGKRRKAA